MQTNFLQESYKVSFNDLYVKRTDYNPSSRRTIFPLFDIDGKGLRIAVARPIYASFTSVNAYAYTFVTDTYTCNRIERDVRARACRSRSRDSGGILGGKAEVDSPPAGSQVRCT